MRALPPLIWLTWPLSACTGAAARAPTLTLADASALVLGAEIALYDGPGPAARRVGTLPAWTPVQVRAQGLECVPEDAERCARRWLLEGGRWAAGGGLAVRQDVPTLPDNLGGNWLDGVAQATDGTQVPAQAFYGVETRYELDEEHQPVRIDATGWLAVPDGDRVRAVSLGSRSGWGTAAEIRGARWVDLDDDARAELLVATAETVTEVGSVGSYLTVLGPDLAERLRIDVGDPRLNGLAQPAWGLARLMGATLVHESVTRVDCPPDLPPPPDASTPGVDATWGTTCVSGTRHTWDHLVPHDEPLALRANGLPILGFHDPEGPTVTGPVPYQVLVRDGAQLRWLRDATLEPAWLAGAFGEDHDAAIWIDLFADR